MVDSNDRTHADHDDHSPISRTHHEREPSAGDEAGEAAGGITGTLAGAALGSAGGPIGTIVGGIAGAAGGWWAGRSISEAASHYAGEDRYYREHHREYSTRGDADVDYDSARVGYGVGHIAGRNPDYRGRPYEEIERDIRSGWADDYEEYETMRPFVQTGYERAADLERRSKP